MKKLILQTMVAIPLCLSSINAQAQGIPVIDTSQLTQVIAQLQQQVRDYEEQVKQFTMMKDQFENMQKRLEAITGAKGMSSILNGAAEKTARTAASDLQSIMDGAIGGTNISGNIGDMNSVISELRTRFDLGDLSDFDGSDVPADRAIASLAGTGMATIATAEDTYKRANSAVTRVNSLVDQIDSTDDLKASIDFNTRVQAEVGVLILELIRVQAASANTTGMMALQQARDGQASRKFMKAGDK